MELQGYVAVALTLILLGYLLPHLVRSRQLLLDSRVEDRFSGELRILATGSEQREAARSRGHAEQARPYLHARNVRRPEATMTSPRARGERVGEDARALAAARAARAARLSRRAAAARRRLVLTTVLLLATAGAWTATSLTSLHWAVAVAPTVLLVTVLVLGRRAAVRARANDRRDRAEMKRLEQRLRDLSRRDGEHRTVARVPAPTVKSRSGDGSRPGRAAERTLTTDAPTADVAREEPARKDPADETVAEEPQQESDRARVAEAEARAVPQAEPVPAPAAVPQSQDGWTPVPVPAPSYTLKPLAPRREVAPYAAQEEAPSAAVPQRPSEASPAPAPEEQPSPALDLDEVLARRRAAGA
ncbi:hypothetical protein [Georgenia alba]|uniref:Uncharacterized protein n=1 Tax=Georgenia alba TaxID=2233858 RepID=A0ABW2QBQ0_9MICO